MLYKSKTPGGYPSLVIPDGESVKIDAHLKGVEVLSVRPRSVAALLVLCGLPPQAPPRLSDLSAFEKVTNTDGLIHLKAEHITRIGGYSAPFVRSVLRALDPQAPSPISVKLQIAHDKTGNAKHLSAAASKADIAPISVHVETQVPVPSFIRDLAITAQTMIFEDIIVGFDATLVINESWVVVNNFLAYGGSHIQQTPPWVAMDVQGTMQGAIPVAVHSIVDNNVAINFTKLGEIAVGGL